MRIISGRARSIRLIVPQSDKVRPTEDKVKESLFATLGDINGCAVLDLFSGTGALGLEALSRGASQVVMIEREELHVAAMRSNLAAVQKAINSGGVSPNEVGAVQIIRADVRTALKSLAGTFDIILADPPYHTAPGEYGGRELLLDESLLRLAADDAIIMLEHDSATKDLPWAPLSSWQLLKSRAFGIRTASFARLTAREER